MKRLFTILLILSASLSIQAQRSNVLAAFQHIDTEKYSDAKEAIEEAILDEKTRTWSRTWYARGLLCQNAYKKGMKDKNKKLYELYPDQLYVAYESFEKAIAWDKGGRLEHQLASNYIILANDLMSQGERNFKEKNYDEALKAFELALEINRKPYLSLALDTNLVYNTALAAYEAKNWEKAALHLNFLNTESYSANIPHLLFGMHMAQSDTSAAIQALSDGISRYDEREDLILLLAEIQYESGQLDAAIATLDSASNRCPEKSVFPYTRGLVCQKSDHFEMAIDAYHSACSIDPDDVNILTNLGICYYNIGVEIEESSRSISNKSLYQQEKAKSVDAYRSAVKWFEKAYEKSPDQQMIAEQLYKLYKTLHLTDRITKLNYPVD